MPVIPVLYSDRSAPHEAWRYQERLFGSGGGAVSISELYGEMSGGTFTFSGRVLPWVTLARPASHYEPAADDDKYGNVADFLHDALVLAAWSAMAKPSSARARSATSWVTPSIFPTSTTPMTKTAPNPKASGTGDSWAAATGTARFHPRT